MTVHEDELRERVRAWKEREHPGRGGLSRAAEALGVSHAMLSEYLNGRRSAKGELLAKGIAKVLGISLDEVHGLPQRTIVPDPTQPMWRNVENWDAAAAEVIAREPHLEPYVEQGGRIAAYRTDRPVTREMVIALATFVRELERDDGTAAAREHEEIKAETADREARQVEGERRIREMEARGEKAPSVAMLQKQLREEGWKPTRAAPVPSSAPGRQGRTKK